MPARLALATLLVLSPFVCSGCERLHDVKRCRALASRVNPALDRIEAISKGEKTRAAYEMIAFEYENIAKSLTDYDAGTPELDKGADDYAALARMSARQASALAEALGANNRASATLATHELERLAHQERALVARIDEECRPK